MFIFIKREARSSAVKNPVNKRSGQSGPQTASQPSQDNDCEEIRGRRAQRVRNLIRRF
jgi:hypothetical protein